jgi:uncharacterized protein
MADDVQRARKKKLAWRPWLRAFHRDVGYLVVGLTVVYAVSGLAVNHIDDWNANYVEHERLHQLGGPLPEGDEAAASVVAGRLGIDEAPNEIFRVDDDELEILYDDRTLTVRLDSGEVHDVGREGRFFVRAANWLHLNRGKAAWTYIADGYAALLLFLALGGMFMIPGRKGLLGRGAVLVALGAAVPIAYVALSGGP